jgi:1-acyl-sn-glycerol-3-phosphate acyltransferase
VALSDGVDHSEAAGPSARTPDTTDFSRFYPFVRRVVRASNRLLFTTTVEGAELVPSEGPFILAPVHRSFIDFWVASEAVRYRKLHYMTKDTLWKNRVLANVIPKLGGFPVHREAADRESLRLAQSVLEAGEVLVLFPEGTRRSGPVIGDLLEGVAFLSARTGAPIVPLGIGGSASVMPKGTLLPRPHHIHLVVGEPIFPPATSASGRVSRSAVHATTEQLRAAIQDLYDRSVAAAGRY